MRHQRVRWIHDYHDDSILLFSEINDDGWEVRKVDEYASGHRDRADANEQAVSTVLGTVRVQPLEEINTDPEFAGTYITAGEFEEIWTSSGRS